MQQTVGNEDSIKGLHSRATDSLVYYAAHDINIYFIRKLLRLNWMTTSFNPNQSPPGGMLIFVLYSDSSSKRHYVKAYFMSQSMRQQRDATKLSATDPASLVFAIIPKCSGGPEWSCPFEEFKQLVLSEIKPECVKLVDTKVLREKRHPDGGWWMYWIVGVVALLIGALWGFLMTRMCGNRSRSTNDPDLSMSLQPERDRPAFVGQAPQHQESNGLDARQPLPSIQSVGSQQSA
jgi:hypothetical protein